MKIIIFYTLMILGVVSIGTVFAEGSLIVVKTNDSNYTEGDTILISGETSLNFVKFSPNICANFFADKS